MNIENEFADFIMQTNKDGSNKARSYLLALKSVNTLLRGGFLPEFDIGNIYDVTDVATLNRLGKHIHKEGRDPQASLIDPDAGEKAKLQPDNALCLSATYAEAFKAHLITFLESRAIGGGYVVAAPIRSKLCVRRRRLRSSRLLTHTYARSLCFFSGFFPC